MQHPAKTDKVDLFARISYFPCPKCAHLQIQSIRCWLFQNTVDETIFERYPWSCERIFTVDTLPVPFESTPSKPDRKPPGRKKGSKNRTSVLLLQAQREIEQKFGVRYWDPVVALATIAADPTTDLELKILALVKVAPYFHATAKPVLVDLDTKKDKPVDLERLMNKVARELLIENHVTVEREQAIREEEVEEK